MSISLATKGWITKTGGSSSSDTWVLPISAEVEDKKTLSGEIINIKELAGEFNGC